MTKVVTASLKQDGTIWPVASFDSHARPRVSSATAIKCKLEKVTKNLLNPNGEVIISDAICFVDTTIAVGSIFRLGTVASVPDTPDNLFEVVNYNELNDIRNIDTGRWIELNLWNKALPTIV